MRQRSLAGDAGSVQPVGFGRTFSSLRNRDFRLLWMSMLASFLGNQMHQVTRGFLALQITGQASSIGWVMASWGVPMLFFSLIGGVVADRFELKRVLMLAQAGQGLMGLGIALLLLFNALEMWHLLAAGVWQGTMFSFNGPARQALIPELVGEEGLANAIALNTAAMNLTRVLGPTLAGVMLAVSGATVVYFFMASTYVVTLVLLSRLPQSGRERVPAEERAPIWEEMKGGVRYVLVENRVVAGLILIALAPVVIGFPYQMMLPVFQKVVFEVDEKGLGFMFAAGGVGALIGSLAVATFANHPRVAQFQLATGVAFGITLAAFAWSPNYWVAMAVLPFVGASSMAFFALNNTKVMTETDPRYYGRVMSLYMLTWAFMPLGGIPIGFLTDAFGAPATIGVSGIVLTLAMVAASRLVLNSSPPRSRVPIAAASAGDGGS